MSKTYNPRQGDIVYGEFYLTSHDKVDKLPCIVISNCVFNDNTKLVIVCPISSCTKEFPTHYILKNTKKIKGSVLCEHIKSVDYEKHNFKLIEKCDDDDLVNIARLANSCFER